MQIDATPAKENAYRFLIDLFDIDEDQPCTAEFVNLDEKKDEKPILDTDGNVIGVFDIISDWIRL